MAHSRKLFPTGTFFVAQISLECLSALINAVF